MWIKKNERMFNLEKFDAIMPDRECSERIVLVSMFPTLKNIAIAQYETEEAQQIMENIANAMQNGDTLYVMP